MQMLPNRTTHHKYARTRFSLTLYGKIQLRENPYSDILYEMNFFNETQVALDLHLYFRGTEQVL